MKTNPEALKDLYKALGGSESDVAECITSVEVMNKISALLEGETGAVLNPNAIENITAVAPTGGGGDSDFSIAEVTLISSENGKTWHAVMPIIGEDYNPQAIVVQECRSSYLSETYLVPLYKGKALILATDISYIDAGVMPIISGGVELTGDGFLITGDCSITGKGTHE